MAQSQFGNGTLMQAHHQWMNRPDDERFLSLTEMHDHCVSIREGSRNAIVESRRITVVPSDEDSKALMIQGPSGAKYAPTNWAFRQLAQLAEAPAGYLQTLPAPIAADAMNYGLQFKRDAEEVGLLLYRNGENVCRAATGPNYGRIWNADIVGGLVHRFGDGNSSDFRIPVEFGFKGERPEITKQNTTLYAGDRDFFVFLADEEHRIEVPDRRNGQSGSLARGFFAYNSEVGAGKFGIMTFLFDYMCGNHIVWGAEGVQEYSMKHTKGAPGRFIEQAMPALEAYAHSSTAGITRAIEQARGQYIGNTVTRDEDVTKFLQARFTKKLAERIKVAHMQDEGRPIETLWDVNTAVTAYARSVPYMDERVELERQGGLILDMATK